jgi:hypothetical protein
MRAFSQKTVSFAASVLLASTALTVLPAGAVNDNSDDQLRVCVDWDTKNVMFSKHWEKCPSRTAELTLQRSNTVSQGVQMITGVGTPEDSVGYNGDYYFDVQTTSVYGPKTDSTWGESTTKTQTLASSSGFQFLKGTSNPTVSSGSVGDMFFNESSKELFGPKTSEGWGAGVSLRGPRGFSGGGGGGTGPQGPAGPQGPKGDTGATGPQGPAGADGADGATGPQGPQGPSGDAGVKSDLDAIPSGFAVWSLYDPERTGDDFALSFSILNNTGSDIEDFGNFAFGGDLDFIFADENGLCDDGNASEANDEAFILRPSMYLPESGNSYTFEDGFEITGYSWEAGKELRQVITAEDFDFDVSCDAVAFMALWDGSYYGSDLDSELLNPISFKTPVTEFNFQWVGPFTTEPF